MLDELGPLENISNKKKPFLHLTDEVELRALFGLMYFPGLFGMTKLKSSRLFEKKVGHPVFSARMSKIASTFSRTAEV